MIQKNLQERRDKDVSKANNLATDKRKTAARVKRQARNLPGFCA
jgi:hypothetical protein